MIGGRWLTALRMGVRVARRSKGRTALIATLIGLPVLGMTLAVVLGRTASLSAAESRPFELGTADARVVVTAFPKITVDEFGYRSADGKETLRDVSKVDLDALLPRGTKLTPDRAQGQPISVRRLPDGGPVQLLPEFLDLSDPLTNGMFLLADGVFPTVDEIALTTPLAERIGVRPGESVRVGDRTARIAGLIRQPQCLDCELLIQSPAYAPAAGSSDLSAAPGMPLNGGATANAATPTYLVAFPAGTDQEALARKLTARGVYLERPGDILSAEDNPFGLGAILLFGGLVLLEVVLLAGAAFAVGARRQTRELGLVGANGGDARAVRRIVLAQSVVLGALGASVGAGIAVLLVVLGRPWWETFFNSVLGPLETPVIDMATVWTVGVVSAVLAALVPARAAARVPIVAALTGRLGQPGSFARSNRRAVALGIAGAFVAAAGALVWRALGSAFDRATQVAAATNGAPPPADTYVQLGPILVLVGVVTAMVGVVTGLPAVLAGIGKVAGALPLTARLAAREAGRQRHRVAPATAAVLAAVTGAVAATWFVAAQDEADRRAYQGPYLPGQIVAEDATPANLDQAVAAVTPHLPDFRVVTIDRLVAPAPKSGNAESKEDGEYGFSVGNRQAAEESIAVGGEEALRALADSPPDSAVEALHNGKAVVFGARRITTNGDLVLNRCCDRKGLVEHKAVTLPAVSLPRASAWRLPTVLIPPTLAAERGWTSSPAFTFLQSDELPTKAQEDAAAKALDQALQGTVRLTVERGYQGGYAAELLAIVVATALVSLGGIVIAVALSAAEGRADLATLAAVGARPRQRRMLAMWSAGVIGVLGEIGGLVMGSAVGALVLAGDVSQPFAIPWLSMTAVAVVTPLAGMVVALVITPGRLPNLRQRVS